MTKFRRDVEAYLECIENPFHRAILKNYFRHLLLEISGYWDQILVPELTIDEPVYRIGHLGKNDRAHRPRRGGKLLPHHLRNRQERHGCTADVHVRRGLRGCHGSPVTEVLTDILARNEHGVTEAEPNAHYLLTHNIFQIFSYTRDAKLVGERVYDDPAGYHYEKLDPATSLPQKMPDANWPHCLIAPRPCTKPTPGTRVPIVPS